MKYIILVIILLTTACNDEDVKFVGIKRVKGRMISITEIDKCEYLFYDGGGRISFCHKGNCRFCEQRRKEVSK